MSYQGRRQVVLSNNLATPPLAGVHCANSSGYRYSRTMTGQTSMALVDVSLDQLDPVDIYRPGDKITGDVLIDCPATTLIFG